MSWKAILFVYLVFIVFLTFVTAVLGAEALNNPTIYTISGKNCGPSPYYDSATSSSFDKYIANGTFTYYVQGMVGLCTSPTPQSQTSSDCILWTDQPFWENFQTTIQTDDYTNVYDCGNCRGQAVEDAKKLSTHPPRMTQLMMLLSVLMALYSPIQATASYLVKGKGYRDSFGIINFILWFSDTSLSRFLISLALSLLQLILLIGYCLLGLIGDEDVDACIQARNWKIFYGCDSTTRLTADVTPRMTFTAISLLFQLFGFTIPETFHYFCMLCRGGRSEGK